MQPFHGIIPIYALAGFFVALIVGMTGVGGGSLMTPVLVRLFGVSPLMAVGTDLLFACATKAVGTGIHGLSGTVDWRLVRRLATGSVPATILTLLVMGHFREQLSRAKSPITMVLGVALILTALAIVFRQHILKVAGRMGEIDPGRAAVLTVALGAVLGVLVSLSSVGAGAIGMTVLLILHPKMPAAKLVGSDIAHAVPLTLVAGLGHWFMGSVNWGMLGSLLVGSVPGIILGSMGAARLPERYVRPALAAILVIVGLRLTF